MPNLKIYVDENHWPSAKSALADFLGPLRDMLCAELTVPVQACQFAMIPVMAMPDLPAVNMELQLLPHPDRTRPAMTALCTDLREKLACTTGLTAAVRLTFLDPVTYVAVKDGQG